MFWLKDNPPKLTRQHVAGRMLTVKPVQLFKLPIELTNAVKRKQVEEIVTQIINLKKSDFTADISGLEARIDSLVYDLYGLTEEEIKIVEC